eukprot:3050319-Rhodomonas_salina.1
MYAGRMFIHSRFHPLIHCPPPARPARLRRLTPAARMPRALSCGGRAPGRGMPPARPGLRQDGFAAQSCGPCPPRWRAVAPRSSGQRTSTLPTHAPRGGGSVW